jgi:hypothetical protein
VLRNFVPCCGGVLCWTAGGEGEVAMEGSYFLEPEVEILGLGGGCGEIEGGSRKGGRGKGGSWSNMRWLVWIR